MSQMLNSHCPWTPPVVGSYINLPIPGCIMRWVWIQEIRDTPFSRACAVCFKMSCGCQIPVDYMGLQWVTPIIFGWYHNTIHPFCLEFPVGYTMLHYQPHKKYRLSLKLFKIPKIPRPWSCCGGSWVCRCWRGFVACWPCWRRRSRSPGLRRAKIAKGGYAYSFYDIVISCIVTSK